MWLLQRLGPAYQSEALAGDLIEQYQYGRSGLWCWRQVIAAIFSAQVHSMRRALSKSAVRLALRVLTEAVAVVALVSLLDQSRRVHSLQEAISPAFGITLIALLCAATIGLRKLFRGGRSARKRVAIKGLIGVFAVTALSAGTLTWAGTLNKSQCGTQACVCQKNVPSLATY
jgi:hypothetical protein